MHRFGLLVLGAIALAAIAGPGPAGGGQDMAQAVFSAAEQAIIADYYSGSGEGPAQGKSKGAGKNKGNKGRGVGSQGLPPGIARWQPPAALTSQLPPAPTGYERAIIDNDLVLVEIVTQIVHDVITNVVTK